MRPAGGSPEAKASRPPPMAYNVAVVGAGVWSENHLLGWRAQPDVTITWVVRSTGDRARQKAQQWGVPHWSDRYEEVVARNDVHIVDILLPHDLHAEAACLALAHGKHVVLEKPLAPTLAEARRIADAARRHRRRVLIAENWIYSTMVQKAHAALARGEIGTPFLIRSTMDLDVRPGFVGLDWRYNAARMGGGALMDAGTHSVSACRYLFGEVREVAAQTSNHGFREVAPLEDTCLLLLRFESGASGIIAVNSIAQRERPRTEFTLLGTEGTIEFDTHARQFFVTRNARRAEEFVLQPSRGFVEQITHFMTCVREDRDPITSPEEQIGSLKVILAAYRAAHTGRSTLIAAIE